MTDQSITCPKCGEEIKLTESLAAPLVAAVRTQYERKLKAQSKEIAEREAALETRATELERKKKSIDAQIAEQVQAQMKSERRAIASVEAKKAKELLNEAYFPHISDTISREFPGRFSAGEGLLGIGEVFLG